MEAGKKTCNRCCLPKPATTEYFPPYRAQGRGLRKRKANALVSTCRSCQAGFCADWHKRNRESEQKKGIARYKNSPELRATIKKRNKEWAVANPIEAARRAKNVFLKRKYNLSLVDFEKLVKAQNGCCAICGHPPLRGSLHVDHDHATSKFRQLVCRPCNMGMGLFADDPERLEAAARYIRRHRGNVVPFKLEGSQ